MSLGRSLYLIRSTLATVVGFFACGYMVLVVFTNVPYFIDSGTVSAALYAPLLLQILVLLAASVAITQPGKIIPFLKTPAASLSAVIALIYLLNWIRLPYMFDHLDIEVADETINRLQRFIIFPAAAFIVFCVRSRVIEWFMVSAIVLVPIPVILDFAFPDLYPTFSLDRSSGTFGNANQAGEAILMWLAVIQNRLKGTPLFIIFLVSLLAVVLTFSRSGMIGMILLWAYLIYRNRFSRITVLIPIMVAVLSPLLLMQAEKYISTVVTNESTVELLLDRLTFVGKINADGTAVDGSTEGRLEVVGEAIEAIIEKPFLGHAIEPIFSLSIPTHNFLLESWYIYGLAGVFMVFWIAFKLIRAGQNQKIGWLNPYLLVYLWFIPFDHQHLSSVSWLVFYAIVLKPVSSGSRKQNWTEKPLGKVKKSSSRRTRISW